MREVGRLTNADVCRLFIIDGVISLPIAIAGFFILPDVPEISRAWYFSKAVRECPSLKSQKLTLRRSSDMARSEWSSRAARTENHILRPSLRRSSLRGTYTLSAYFICKDKL
jgi:hypothetical protein